MEPTKDLFLPFKNLEHLARFIDFLKKKVDSENTPLLEKESLNRTIPKLIKLFENEKQKKK